ncbi:collagen alpha-4(VI) chain-like isoform X2 [Magallana gigas]|uniref:collagen alpha-4(VI) chain-like isoform X2 n=1 Tax=Magallana gigas TaxID=29159 RepID=UPI0033416A77
MVSLSRLSVYHLDVLTVWFCLLSVTQAYVDEDTEPPRSRPKPTTAPIPKTVIIDEDTEPPRSRPKPTTAPIPKTVIIDEDIEPPRSRPKPTTTSIPITVINQCFAQVDVVFLLDSSTSVGNDNYDKMKSFVTKFLHYANIDNGDVRVGLLSYSTRVTVEFKLNSKSTKADVFDAVNALPWRYGSTNTADGLKTMHEELFNVANGDRPGVPNICIIMTDDVSNINYRRTIPEADVAKKKGIRIYAVGIALKDLKEVNGIASEPASTNVFAVNTFDELERLDVKLFTATCSVSTPTTRPLPTGYDVVLVLDSSVPQETYQFMKDYAKNLVNGFDVENEDYRIGLLRYSTDADIQFDLDKYSTREALKLAIDKTTYKPGNTDTAKAINSVRENMFIEPRGDRNFARNLIFLLTGQDKSKDTFDAWAAAQKAEAEGINLFTVGINLNDTMELDELSTHPIETYRQLINTDQPPAELNLTLSEILGRIDDNVEPERPRKGPTGENPGKILSLSF